MLDSGKFESRAAVACYLGVSRAKVTQVLPAVELGFPSEIPPLERHEPPVGLVWGFAHSG